MRKFKDPRAGYVCQILSKNPELRGKKIAEMVGLSPSGMYHVLSQEGLTLSMIRKEIAPELDGKVEYPPRPAKNAIVVPEWLTRPLRSYRHIKLQYHNGVPG